MSRTRKIEITISGVTNTGKSRVGYYITQMLRAKGFEVNMTDDDPVVAGADKVDFALNCGHLVTKIGPNVTVDLKVETQLRSAFPPPVLHPVTRSPYRAKAPRSVR